MSAGLSVLAATEDDYTKLLMAQTHVGARNLDFQMKKYVYKRKPDGFHIINVHKTWEKMVLAARVIVAIENPQDVCAISGRPYGQRAVLKFAAHIGASAIAGRYTPGTFTNQIQRAFQEPRILVVTDPRTDHQPIAEASYVNIPVIAICDTDTPLRYVDIAIPANNKSIHSIGLIWWLLARQVKRLRGSITYDTWEIMPDLYFYRDPEEAEKEEREALAAAAITTDPAYSQWDSAVPTATDDWNAAAPAAAFGAAPAIAAAPVAAAPAAAPVAGAPAATDDWGAVATGGEWAAAAPGWDATA